MGEKRRQDRRKGGKGGKIDVKSAVVNVEGRTRSGSKG
jgi:hypothetical protein